MLREFEIFTKSFAPSTAVKRGLSWPGFFFTWIWAFSRGLWLHGALILAASIVATFIVVTVFDGNPIVSAFLSLVLQLFVGLKGNSWRSAKLERIGYGFAGVVLARSPASALSNFSLGADAKATASHSSVSFLSLPGWFQRLLAITWLTWKAALRFRLFIVVAALLLGAVVGLPILIKDDGTARGFTQILLTYTLSAITALLGLSTLWLSCGTLARDIEDCQIQMVAVKPIARWQIWLGKWLGIMSLNAALLAISGAGVYGLLQWRATKLPENEQRILRNEVFVARGSAKEASYDKDIEESTDRQLKAILEKNPLNGEEAKILRQKIKESTRAGAEVVQPGKPRPWEIHLGSAKNHLRGQPLYLRVKFNAAEKSPTGTFLAAWQIGIPGKTKYWRSSDFMSLAPETFHEFEIPPDLFDENGVLTVFFLNPNNTTLLFPLDDGLEVLYREGGFGPNFIRGLGIILCWMGLLSAIGLAAASFLSFPVAAFASMALLVMTFSTGTMNAAIEQGTILGYDAETGAHDYTIVDEVALPLFRVALKVINFARGFSPIDSLSTGRSIPWSELSSAFLQIVIALGGIIAVFGVFAFHRRELATAQANQ
jgi:hypothetical protein